MYLICFLLSIVLEVMVEGNYAFEEILNSTSHGIAFLFSVLGCIILMSEVMSDTNGKMHPNEGMSVHFWACAVYSFSLMFLFLCSSLYHSFFMLPMASRVLQILDHVGIYMLIAGSYTPFLLIGLHGQLSATVLLCAEWLAVFCGILFSAQADFNSETTTIIELVTFVAMGCSVAFIWPSMSASLSTAAIGLLVGGGAAYVVGIYFFIKGETKPIYHTVWHLFVILGAACHWFDVYLFVVNTRLGDVFQHCLLDLSDTIATGEIHSDHAAELLHLCIEGLNNESAH
jgi:hemolysin III